MNYEFEILYDRLIKAVPHIYKAYDKKKSVSMAVQAHDKKWFTDLVVEIEQNPKGKINIEERARIYRFAKFRIVETKQIIAECENRTPESTEGLQNFLNEVGAESAVEAISKVKNYGVAK